MSDKTRTSKTVTDESDGCPWRLGKSYNLQPILALHKELQDFFDYIKPTKAEYNMRIAVVDRVTKAIQSEWPSAEVKVFGSFPNNLILPNSDIDIVVFGKWNSLPLHEVSKILLDNGVCCDDFQVIDKTKVPIVKITDKMSGVRSDLSFNMQNSMKSTILIKKFIDSYPMIPKLVLVIKQLLNQIQMNQVYTGGVSSYSLLLMVISFLQLYPNKKVFDDLPVNLATLLMDFFELYGKKFDYHKNAIRVTDGGRYVTKNEVRKNMVGRQRTGILCIEDPLTPGNDVSSGSFGVLKVKDIFARAFDALKAAVEPQNFSPDKSILGRLIRIDARVKLRRQWIEDNANALQNILGSEVVENDRTTVKVSENDTVHHELCVVNSTDETEPRNATIRSTVRDHDHNNRAGDGGKRPRETYRPSSDRNPETVREQDLPVSERVKKSYPPYVRPGWVQRVIDETFSSALPVLPVTVRGDAHHVTDENGGLRDGDRPGNFGNDYRNDRASRPKQSWPIHHRGPDVHRHHQRTARTGIENLIVQFNKLTI